jgi:hypothetical protein
VDHLTLEELDRDGALQDVVGRISGSRADVLQGAVGGGAALLAFLLVPGTAIAATVKDADVLNYALSLEYLQAAFYEDAVMVKKLRGEPLRAARVVGSGRGGARRRIPGAARLESGETASLQLPRHHGDPEGLPPHRDRPRGPDGCRLRLADPAAEVKAGAGGDRGDPPRRSPSRRLDTPSLRRRAGARAFR